MTECQEFGNITGMNCALFKQDDLITTDMILL